MLLFDDYDIADALMLMPRYDAAIMIYVSKSAIGDIDDMPPPTARPPFTTRPPTPTPFSPFHDLHRWLLMPPYAALLIRYAFFISPLFHA